MTKENRLRAHRRGCLARMCAAVLIIGVLVTPGSYGAGVKQVVPGDEIKTVAGVLKISKTWFDDYSWINRVFLNSKAIFEDSDNEGPISIEATYPTTVPVHLVLLGVVEGGSACPMILRVLEIKESGEHHLSKEFGNCFPPADKKWFKVLKENPAYQNGEWRIALPPPGGDDDSDEAAAKRATFEWYIYRDGKITKKMSPAP